MNQPPVILALDSSTGPASIALMRGGEVLAHVDDAQNQRQAAQLVPNVDTLVKAHGGFEAVDMVAVTTGPGTFTGIRIALAAARGFALACNCPVLGISSLETLAWQALATQPQGVRAIAVINAHRQQSYVQVFARTPTALRAEGNACAIDNDQLMNWVAKQNADFILSTNPDVGRHIPAPRAEDAGALAFALWQNNPIVAAEQHPPEAFYIRPPDAKPQTPFLHSNS